MEFNHLHFMWMFYSFVVTFSGVNVLFVKNIPSIFVRFYTFGKTHNSFTTEKSIIKWLEIPKRWFSHFYVFAVVYFFFITKTVLFRYFGNVQSPFFVQLLDLFGSSKRVGAVDAESVIILSILLLFQVCRRFYECFFVSVYSDARMNISHYIVGLTFYFGVGLSLLHDAPGFEKANGYSTNYISNRWFTFSHCMGAMLFLQAFSLQFKTHKVLASLRKTGDKVISTSHHLPTSGFFEYVSCPHYFAEIMIYLSACIILSGRSYSWWLVCLWTVCNQIFTALLSHRWYKKTFKNYPVKRKAIIPFLL